MLIQEGTKVSLALNSDAFLDWNVLFYLTDEVRLEKQYLVNGSMSP